MSVDPQPGPDGPPQAATSGARATLPEAVLFDHDGVLVDSVGPDFQACLRLFREHGVELPVERWAREVCGNTDGYSALFGLLSGSVAEGVRTASGPAVPPGSGSCAPGVADTAALRARLEGLWQELLVPANVSLMPGVRELLTRLRGHGIRLAVASSADRRWVMRWLTHYELADLFDAVVGGDEVARKKPAPDVYLEALSRLGASPGRALAVEDSLTGVAAARAAGLRVVAVPTRYTRSLDYAAADVTVTGLPLLTDALLDRICREDAHVAQS
ncbi:HAD family hydrolase [Streptomyces levis]|uniref:HAD family hydrolase n=1 Tax=Streptomyces levis TaxID=285566 RepID=A0ABN3P3Y9_9ACTN